ncbi:hypothetical protein AA313_de0204619 [Arthrobotrys entomopaga]|nr:hypothetical protein AA313_de0204619 [Arthrobotrys entomopaga]
MYESLPTLGGSKVVERESAVMNLGKIETQVMLDGTNHRTMCKYKERTDQNYLAVLDAIKRLTRSTSTLFEPPDIPVPRDLPPVRASAQYNPYFDPSASTTSFASHNSGFSGDGVGFMSTTSFTSASTQGNRDNSFSPPPPRPPAKEPVATQWPSYFTQDNDRRYAPSTIYDSQGTPVQSSKSRNDGGFAPPPSYSSPNWDSNRNNFSSSRSVLSDNSTSSLYDAAYTPFRPPNGPTSPDRSTNQSANSQRLTNTQNSPNSAYNSFRSSAASPTNSNADLNRSTRTSFVETSKPRPQPPSQTPKEHSPGPTPTLPPPESPHWICDACKNPIYPFDSRIHCLDCPDYDLCGNCHAMGKITKTHKRNHKEEFIIKARQITQEQNELIIPSEVHPERSPGRQFVNWVIQDERRVHHLSCHDDHARYLISNLEPGNYRVSFHLDLFLVKEFTESHIKQLGKEPLGKLRVAVGFIKNKKTFFKDIFPEDMSLASRLFDFGYFDDYNVSPVSGPTPVNLKCILTVDGTEERDDVGIMFQWSEFRKFQSSDKALISFALVSARFEDLMEFDPTFGGAIDKAKEIDKYSHPPSQEPAGAKSQPAAQPEAPTLSLNDIFQAIMEVAQEERDRQEQEAFQQAIAEELARRRRAQVEAQEREAAAQLMANYMVATQATVEFALLNEYLRYLTNS